MTIQASTQMSNRELASICDCLGDSRHIPEPPAIGMLPLVVFLRGPDAASAAAEAAAVAAFGAPFLLAGCLASATLSLSLGRVTLGGLTGR